MSRVVNSVVLTAGVCYVFEVPDLVVVERVDKVQVFDIVVLDAVQEFVTDVGGSFGSNVIELGVLFIE